MSLTVPAAVEAVIEGMDDPNTRLDENELSSALMNARKELHGASADQQKGAFAEVAAWDFMRSDKGKGVPWGLYWVPMASGMRKDGITPFYVPDVAELDDEILAHWIYRATHSRHPTIACCYADLCWEVGRYLRKAPDRRSECGAALSTIEYPSEMPRHAVDGYLAVVEGELLKDEYDAWMYLSRAVGLATQINDTERKARVKAALFRYQERLDATEGPKMWWRLHNLVSLPRFGRHLGNSFWTCPALVDTSDL